MGFWEKFLGFDPNRQRSFPGQQPGEEVEHLGVFHWMVLAPFFLQIVAVIAGVVVLDMVFDLFSALDAETLLLLKSISLTLLVHIIGLRILNYFLKVIMITNYRLIDIRHTVFLRREREVIPMTNIQDIRYQQNGVLPRILKYGELIVLGSSSDVQYRFKYVPKVNKMHHLIGEIHQKALHRNPQLFMNRPHRELREPVEVS